MAYVSLYRKYRPQTFAEVVGQEHVTTTLARAVDEGRPHHAYLFTGPRGTGKTSTARILAKSLNCEQGPTSQPDGTCQQCVAIAEGSSVDVIEIDAASHGGVDDIRDLRERVAFAPASARTKVYIVDECHMLSTAGWNAFLKTVEEPPGHVVFVFATTEPHKVLPTILSRTQRFDLRRIAADKLAAHVEDIGRREGLTFEPGAVDLIVRAGDGSARDTLSVLDQVAAYGGTHLTLRACAEVLGSVPGELLLEAADGIAAGDVAGLAVLVSRLGDAGVDLRQFARDAVEHLRALLLLQAAPDAGLVDATPEQLERLSAQAGRLGRVELLRAVELLAEAQVQMRRGNTRLPLEVALIKAALPESSGDPAAIAARMDRLERRMGLLPDQGEPAPAPSVVAAPSADEPPPRAVETAPPSPAPPTQAQRPEPEPEPQPEPASEPEPEPEPEPAVEPSMAATRAAAVDLELVRSSWAAVLAAVKERRRTLHALLNEGHPTSLDGTTLTLTFDARHSFHAGEVARDAWVPLFAEVFTELFGSALRVRAQLGSPGAAPVPVVVRVDDPVDEEVAVAESEEAEQIGDVPDDGTARDLAIATLQRHLGATVIDGDG